jgi:hypothetical protein
VRQRALAGHAPIHGYAAWQHARMGHVMISSAAQRLSTRRPLRTVSVNGSAAASPCNTATLSGSMSCGGHATVGSTVRCLNVRVLLPDFVRSMVRRCYSLCAWLRAAGLAPVRSTRNSYVVTGRGDVIHAVGTAEAYRTLEAIFRPFDRALCHLIHRGYVPVAATE